MKIPEIKHVYVSYVESGCFAGGEQACYDAGIKRDETCVVLKKEDFIKLKTVLEIVEEDFSGDVEYIQYQIKKLFT
jgi:hypothetical protein